MRGDQEKIAEWLSGCAPPLADAYRGAVRLLADTEFPGRVRFICHAARDIANRVPDLIGRTTQVPRVEVTKDLDELDVLWSQYSLHQRGPTAISPAGDQETTSPDNEIPIPARVFRQLTSLLEHHNQVSRKHRERATTMLEAIAPENKDRQEALVPIANQWVEITRWFVSRAHAAEKETIVTEEELRAKFLTLENQVTTLLAPFYEPVKVLDTILEEANS